MEVYPPWLEMQDYCHLRHHLPEPSFDPDAPEVFSQTDGWQTARIGGVGATTWLETLLSCDSRNKHGLSEIEKDYRCQ